MNFGRTMTPGQRRMATSSVISAAAVLLTCGICFVCQRGGAAPSGWMYAAIAAGVLAIWLPIAAKLLAQSEMAIERSDSAERWQVQEEIVRERARLQFIF